MNNEVLNNMLAELEDELKSMDSARNQVLSLSQTINLLTDKYNSTLKKVDEISKSIYVDQQYFENNFGESVKKLNIGVEEAVHEVSERLDQLLNEAEKSTTVITKAHRKGEKLIVEYTDNFAKTLNHFANDVKKESDEITSQAKIQQIKFHSNIQTSFAELTATIEDKNNELKQASFYSLLQSVDGNICKFVEDLNDASERIQENGDKLSKILGKLDDNSVGVNKRLDQINKDISDKSQMNLIVTIVLGIIILGAMFFIK